MRIEVPAEAAGERLDVFLAAHVGSRAAAQRTIDAGRVRVDGEARAKRYALHGGEVVEVREGARGAGGPRRPRRRSRSRGRTSTCSWSTSPRAWSCTRRAGTATGTLAQALERRGAAGGEPGRAGLVHRLDRDTSGLLVVARSEEVHAALKAQLKARGILREYLALVEGRPGARSGKIEAPLGRDRRVRTRISTDTADGRAAVTHFDDRARRSRATRSCACGSRPGARTRSART